MLEHLSLPDTVRLNLRRRILNDELPAGSRLVEGTLAAELGVSRATIRQAMRELSAEGLIEISPRRYSLVTRMSAEDARDVCYARYVLEAGAANQIPARRRVELDLAMGAALRAMDDAVAADDVEALVEADILFHRSIFAVSGTRRLCDLWETVNSQMGALMRGSIDRRHMDLADVRAFHDPLREAFINGTARTIERALNQHYLDSSVNPLARAGAASA